MDKELAVKGASHTHHFCAEAGAQEEARIKAEHSQLVLGKAVDFWEWGKQVDLNDACTHKTHFHTDHFRNTFGAV